MIDKQELIKWLTECEGTQVGINDGGLTLVAYDGFGQMTTDYYEVGGTPDPAESRSFKLTDIRWDTDAETQEEVGLPDHEFMLLTDPEDDPSIVGADWLSDKYGYCVQSFNFEEIHEKQWNC